MEPELHSIMALPNRHKKFSGINVISDKTHTIFSVRAVLVSMCTAIVINLICIILTTVYFYGSYKSKLDECDLPDGETCYSCALLENSRYSYNDNFIKLNLFSVFKMSRLESRGMSVLV